MPKSSRAKRQTTHSNTYRFFVATPIEGSMVMIDDRQLAHQLSNVLRLQPGDEIVLLDNSGEQYVVALQQLGRDHATGTVVRRAPASGEPQTHVTLYLGLMRPERFEWALQKCTELGAAAFVPLVCERSAAADMSERKAERWSRIVREAAEQSRRGRLPHIAAAQSFDHACATVDQYDLALLLWEGAGVQSLRHALRAHTTPLNTIAVLSGPEGGLSDDEFKTASEHGIIPVTLGPRTLRAETAPVAATTAILYECGDMETTAQA
ncbi:MAG TPA: 16S rRNA (uracil(1498)-N(3))-methyltransferase [Roseiflexaceae bacterium]|jgi:16S rRNA (uracil1498-N3)-methyltransferase|nr:16S rRNA (uracil(1498)-N(3))-methyltransferase [Roseiflexaceae bacterium]